MTWEIERHTLCTTANTHVEAFKYVEGSLKIDDVVQTNFDTADPRWNCHGDSFSGGAFQINNDQVGTILADEYRVVDLKTEGVRVGDVVIFRDASWSAVHSTQVVDVIAGLPPKTGVLTFGKRGQEPFSKEQVRPMGPGNDPSWAWGDETASVEVYRRKLAP